MIKLVAGKRINQPLSCEGCIFDIDGRCEDSRDATHVDFYSCTQSIKNEDGELCSAIYVEVDE